MSRRIDTAEAVTNALVGLGVSILAVHAVWPLMGWAVSAGQSVTVSVMFFLLSTARAYVLRRVFRKIGSA